MFKRIFPFSSHATAIYLVAAYSLSACSGGVLKQQNPPVAALEVPTSLSAGKAAIQPADAAALDWLQWWKSFQDPVLDALVQEAASNNQDLALASARITEARATLSQNQANLYPSVDLNAGLARRRASTNSATYNPAAGNYSNDAQLGLSASYEIDFWGKYASADQAARARMLAQGANRGVVLSSLYASAAQSYFALRALDAQAVLAEQTLATRQENVHLQKRRLDGGVSSELDLRQAESEAASVRASLQATQQNRSLAEAALALLLGRQPGAILQADVARGSDVASLLARLNIPTDLPSALLQRRPDIVAAEYNLQAAQADIAQARSAYFPRVALTASLGDQSKSLSNLLDPASLFWNLLGNLTQPVFRAGAIDSLVAAANARQQQALAQYTQAVQNAFRDVHDALTNATAAREIAATTQQRLLALRSTLRLANVRYQNGYSSYLEVLSAQRDVAQAESGLIDIQRAQLSAAVALYKALGGGWDAAAPIGQASALK